MTETDAGQPLDPETGEASSLVPPQILHSLDPRRGTVASDTSAPAAPSAPGGHETGLPPEVFSTQKPLGRYPGRTNPRRGDLVVTIIFTVVLYLLAIEYVGTAVTRANDVKVLLNGVQLANVLAVALPIVLALFSTVFSILFLLRRVYAFWLPVFAGVLIVALFSITGDMLNATVIGGP
ncbi:MAG: hypothetical protein JWP75_1317 [Frondihabitans sp.]|nr:hypothetical protein [Frondihabitans sp.]